MLPPLPPQSHTHGGHVSPGAHAAQAQAQPPPVLPPPEDAAWHTPDTHVSPALHGRPKANHWHWVDWNERQLVSSVNCEQASLGGAPSQVHGGQPASLVGSHAGQAQVGVLPGAGEPELVPPPVDGSPDGVHAHSHGGQSVPGAQAIAGHAHAQVPPDTQPPPVLPGVQVQSHGGQLEPGAQSAQAQVQLPPEPEPVEPPEQSHSTGGQFPSAVQYSGLAHAQLPAVGERAWQKPSTEQSVPTGHRRSSADHAQPFVAAQAAAVDCAAQGSSSTHAPAGQVVPAGQLAPRASQLQPVSASHDAASACCAHAALATMAATLPYFDGSFTDDPHPSATSAPTPTATRRTFMGAASSAGETEQA